MALIFLFRGGIMGIDIRIQAKTAEILKAEAEFFKINPTALAKAILDKIVAGGLTREVMQGVDVASYQDRKRGRPRKAGAV